MTGTSPMPACVTTGSQSRPDVAEALGALGLSAVEQGLYEALTADPSMTGAELDALGAERGWPAPERRAALDRLGALGLVTEPSAEDAGPSAGPPYSAFDGLLATRADDLRRARDRMLRLSARFHRHTEAGDTHIEVVRGHAEITRFLAALNRSVSRSVIGFDTPPYLGDVTSTGVGNVTGSEEPPPGVTHRILYDPRSLSKPGRVGEVATARRAENRIRFAELPVKFFLLDGQAAVMLLDRDTFPTDALMVVHEPHLLAALAALFETYWTRAVPAQIAPAEPGPRGAQMPDGEPELLALLVAGYTDRTIADQLGWAERTVRRRIADMMRRLGADNRFQAGYHAVTRGWLATEHTRADEVGQP